MRVKCLAHEHHEMSPASQFLCAIENARCALVNYHAIEISNSKPNGLTERTNAGMLIILVSVKVIDGSWLTLVSRSASPEKIEIIMNLPG